MGPGAGTGRGRPVRALRGKLRQDRRKEVAGGGGGGEAAQSPEVPTAASPSPSKPGGAGWRRG